MATKDTYVGISLSSAGKVRTMDLHLANKIALITGASSGIGAATAHVLAEEGADVIVAYHRNVDGAQQTAKSVQQQGRRAWLCQMDVGDPTSAAAALHKIQAEVPVFDIVVLCAGYNVVTPFEQILPDEWNQVISINLNGPFYVLQAILPLLRSGAAVVTVASVAAHTGAPHHPHYAAAKAGLVNLTKSAALALSPNVRVNCVAPGMTLTPMGATAAASLAPDYAQTRLLTQRFATPDEIGRCIAFVASPIAGFMSGATIDINGGRDLR